MGYEYDVDTDSVFCQCGHSFVVNLYDKAYGEALIKSHHSIEREVECPSCHRKYDLSLEVYVSVECDYDIKEIPDVSANALRDARIGDSVALEDGEYKFGSYIYLVQNGQVHSIFSALTDSNQINLFEMAH